MAIIGETTDRSTIKQMNITVQYRLDSKNKMQNSFLDLVEVHDSTAEGLAKTVIIRKTDSYREYCGILFWYI